MTSSPSQRSTFADAVIAATTPAEPDEPPVPPNLVLQLTGADGTAVMAVPVALDGGHDEGQNGAEGFFWPIPWVDGATALELEVDGTVVDSIAIAPTPPKVSNLTVSVEDEAIRIAGALTVPDIPVSAESSGSEPALSVLWSNDDGETWIPVAVDVASNELSQATPPADTTPQLHVSEDLPASFEYEIPTSVRLPVGTACRSASSPTTACDQRGNQRAVRSPNPSAGGRDRRAAPCPDRAVRPRRVGRAHRRPGGRQRSSHRGARGHQPR